MGLVMGCNRSRECNEYESLGWKVILQLVNTYSDEGKLESGWLPSDVDGILSEWVDIPRNLNELNRVEPWARAILDEKAYINNSNLQKKLTELRDLELSGGSLGSSLLLEHRNSLNFNDS